jgi:hypothetical protein
MKPQQLTLTFKPWIKEDMRDEAAARRGLNPDPSRRTRFLASADVSSCVWMPGNAEESNVLIGSMWPDEGRRWLPRVARHRGRPPR